MQQEEYLNQFELNLTRTLIEVLTQQNRLSGTLLPSPDLDDKWEAIAEPYIADAVKEIASYPTVALGWMMYVGMAVAHLWDIDWSVDGNIDHLYEYLRDKRGFDRLDEYIRETTLGIRPTEPEYTRLEELVRMSATICLTQIRREGIEPQSPMAFHVFVRATHALYLVGASIELYKLGYKMSAN